MLKVAFDFSIRWRLKYNVEKCAVVVFDDKDKQITLGPCVGKCQCNHHFQFGPSLIQEVLIYKYLGVELDNRLLLKEFKFRILKHVSI